MGNALWYPLFRGTDDDGNPLNGGKLYSYNAGTSTPRACYAEKGATTPLSNPVILDSRGEKEIYLSGSYKLVLKTSTDVTIWTLDNIEGAIVDDVVWGIVTNETALLALSTTGLTDGEMRICSTNGNRYYYEAGSDKFTPIAGNRYATGDLPGASYNIEDGTITVDTTLNLIKMYYSSAWNIIWQMTVNMGDNTLQRANLLDYGVVTNAIGAVGGGAQTIDLELGNAVNATIDTSETTLTFSNPTASDEECGFTLYLTNGGSQTVNWPASVDWGQGTAPALTASGLDVIVFTTIDGGTTWYGFLIDTDIK